MKRTLSSFFVLILLATGLVSCGGSSKAPTNSGLTYRAFVSNPLNPTVLGSIFPGLNIVDVRKDVLSPFNVDLSATTGSAGMMVESPKRDRTVVFSPTTNTSQNNSLAIVDNAKETASGSVTLPGPTESMFIWTDDITLFAAISTAAVTGQPAGAVLQIDISNNSVKATIPIPGARFVVPNSSGNAILAISDTANAVTVIAPSLIATGNPLTTVATSSGLGFDRPVWAVFSSDGSTAYVLNCGAQCGGSAASISVVNMTTTPPAVTSVVPVAAATYGMLSGGNLYVAGTPVSGANCQTTLCGVLTIFPGANLTATPTTLAITDGYHTRMVQGPNNQLFIGSRTCTDVIASGSTPGRGCLSVINTAANTVYTAAQNGDVTGIRPIEDRAVVYVCEGGALQIYDTDFDLESGHQLQVQRARSDGSGQLSVTGQAVDVVLVDFPNGSVITN